MHILACGLALSSLSRSSSHLTGVAVHCPKLGAAFRDELFMCMLSLRNICSSPVSVLQLLFVGGVEL